MAPNFFRHSPSAQPSGDIDISIQNPLRSNNPKIHPCTQESIDPIHSLPSPTTMTQRLSDSFCQLQLHDDDPQFKGVYDVFWNPTYDHESHTFTNSSNNAASPSTLSIPSPPLVIRYSSRKKKSPERLIDHMEHKPPKKPIKKNKNLLKPWKH